MLLMIRWLFVFATVVAVLGGPEKLCCDQDCSQAISYGRTVTRYLSRDKSRLQFPASSIVTVFAKGVGLDDDGHELWEAEIQGKRGLILNHMVNEVSQSCEPKPVLRPQEEQVGSEMGQDPSETPQVSQSDTQDPSKAPQVSQLGTQDPSKMPQASQLDPQDPSEMPQTSQLGTQDPSETPQASQSDTQDPSETPQASQLGTQDPSETPQASQSDTQDPSDLPDTPENTSADHKDVVKPTNPKHVFDTATPTSQLSNLNPTTSGSVYSSNTTDPATPAPSAEPQSQQDTTQVFENLAASSGSEAGLLSHSGEGPSFEEGGRSGGGHVPEHIEKWRRDEKAHEEDSSKEAPQQQEPPQKELEHVDTHLEDIELDRGQGEPVKEAWKPEEGDGGSSLESATEQKGVTGGLEEGDDEGVVRNLEGEDNYRREDDQFGGTVDENSAANGVGIQEEDSFKHAAHAEFPDGGVPEEDQAPPNSSHVSEARTVTVTNYPPMETNKMEPPTPERPSEPPPPSPEEEEDAELPFGEFVDEDELRTITLKSGEQGKIYLDHGGRATIVKDSGDKLIADYDYLTELGVDDDRLTYLEELDLENFDYDTYLEEGELEDIDRMTEREGYYESGLPEPPPQFLPPKLDDDDDVTSSERERSGQRDYLNFEAIRERLLQEQAKKPHVDQEDTLDQGSSYHDIETPQGKDESHSQQEHEKIPEHIPLEDFSQPPVFSAALDKDEPPRDENKDEPPRDENKDEPPRDENKDEWEKPEPEPPTFQPEELPSPPSPPQYEDQEETGVAGVGLWGSHVKMALQFLPLPVATWIVTQGPDIFLISVLATAMCITLPLCLSCCRNRNKMKLLKQKTIACRKLEEQLAKLKEEKGSLETSLHGEKDRCRSVEEELMFEKKTSAELEQAKADTEAHYQALANSLAATQEEVAQHQRHLEQLNTQLGHEQAQLSAQIGEKEVAHQQIALLMSQLQQSDQRVQELEATRDQLEQDLYSTQQTLQQLQTDFDKVSKEHDESQQKCTSLETELGVSQEEASSLRETVTEQGRELETLRECLRQVSEGTVSEGTDEDGGREAQLAKIQAMLDTTKAQTQLREVTEERDQLATQLQERTNSLEQFRAENVRVHDRVAQLEDELRELTHQYDETQLRLRHLTEYFEQKEHSLHRKLGAEEVARLAVETRETEAQHKAATARQEREEEREELKGLRKQMVDIEKSLKEQVLENEKRAEAAYTQLRKTENDLRMANMEITNLRKRLGPIGRRTISPPPRVIRPLPPDMRLPGPGARPRGGPRPPSATQFPRTSSPEDDLNGPQAPLRTNETRPHSSCEAEQPELPDLRKPSPPLSDLPEGSMSQTQLLHTSYPGPFTSHQMDSKLRPVSPPNGDIRRPRPLPPPSDRPLPPSRFRRLPPPPHHAPPPPTMRPHSNPPLGDMRPPPPPRPFPQDYDRRPPSYRRSPPLHGQPTGPPGDLPPRRYSGPRPPPGESYGPRSMGPPGESYGPRPMGPSYGPRPMGPPGQAYGPRPMGPPGQTYGPRPPPPRGEFRGPPLANQPPQMGVGPPPLAAARPTPVRQPVQGLGGSYFVQQDTAGEGSNTSVSESSQAV